MNDVIIAFSLVSVKHKSTMKQISLLLFILLFFYAKTAFIISTEEPNNSTSITTRNYTGKIGYRILNKPHHLFVGRCKALDKVLHQENIILKNDGKSQILAGVRTNVEGPVNITCVKIFDEIPYGEGGYPSFVAGGVGHNYIEFNILNEYGKGFHFFVQIFGYEIPPKIETNTTNKEDNDQTTTLDPILDTEDDDFNRSLDDGYQHKYNVRRRNHHVVKKLKGW